MPSTKNIVDKFLYFLSKKDLNNLIELFDDNVDWDVPGNTKIAPWLGQRNNKNDVRNFYELLWKNVEPISANIENIFIENEQVLLAGEFNVKMLATGNSVRSIFYIQITVKNGLIVKYRLLEDSYAISESLTCLKPN